MYGIIGEDDSDFDMLKAIIKKHKSNDRIVVKGGGLGNCNLVISRGARELKALRNLGMRRFIVCHDSDTQDARAIKKIEVDINKRVIKPSGIKQDYKIVIPVQEIEAWILADIGAVTKLIPSWKPPPKPTSNPEARAKPCEWLESQSKVGSKTGYRQLYFHTQDNRRIVQHLDFQRIRKKCNSFDEFLVFLDQE